MSKELKQQQIEYMTMGLLSAYYSGCSEHMIKAYMDGLREQLGDKYTDFINWTKPVSNYEEAGDDGRIYPCADCGAMRSKNEGGTTFTVCDECWEKHTKKEEEEEKERIKWMRGAHRRNFISKIWNDLKNKIEEKKIEGEVEEAIKRIEKLDDLKEDNE